MKDRISETIEGLQWSLRMNDVLSRFSKICFFLMLGLCVLAIGMKMVGVTFPGVFVVLALLGAAGISAPALWRYTPYACAVLVDRKMGLDERLSTCFERLQDPATPFLQAQRRDTLRALDSVDLDEVRRLRSPRELLFAGAFALVLAVILIAPNPVRSDGSAPVDKGLAEEAAEQERRLREAEPPDSETAVEARASLEEILRKIQSESDPESVREHLENMERVKRSIERGLEASNLTPGERQELEKLLAFLAGAVRGLARHVDPAVVPEGLFAPRPGTDRRIEDLAGAEPPPDPAADAPPAIRNEVKRSLVRRGWDPRFDPVINKFFGKEP